ncbi:pseudouridine synthase TruD/Pus7, putative [Talaromyces stipitatus ATCC 10500]|uniref:Pseudouridine synthase TruD/Pus7, putative n=1 Tax=Talaromyces stipitatus (strain ATCC 10500 / CBS 375.48 / QM 6759 / NRRL 1006) TaxID=441959 RepID=B8M3F8_TALSN|nr:pseudouridine synthase TruD/Pus7, putative [Talaromyces stipitatus ATCC 10500]EED22330.1 pseudouridine synthase TruD/Pus7, putative [Talaromyces stipitatus ATCC 10500]
MEREEIVESPRKRVKIDNPQNEDNEAVVTVPNVELSSPTQATREVDVGITEFVSADIPGFEGILKKRYTDFLVNEILPSGEVLHLQNLNVPQSLQSRPVKDAPEQKSEEQITSDKTQSTPGSENLTEKPEFSLSDDDRAQLEELFGPEAAAKIIDLHARVLASPNQPPKKFGQVEAATVDDKDVRTKMHMTLRRIFNSLLESRTNAENVMIIGAAPNRHKKSARGFRGEPTQKPARSGWEERGGQYLHFTIYKENKDTMEVISFLARNLKMHPKGFQFAGTKDRRGVTVQRACVFKVVAERLAGLNKILRNAAVGDFEYNTHGMDLGDLEGNEFVITLRDCQFLDSAGQASKVSVSEAKELVGKAMFNLRERGYLNYYGMQRFGTFAIGTHEVGLKMLRGDFKGAVDALLHFSPQTLSAAQNTDNDQEGPLISSDDKARAEAIHIYRTTNNVNNALEKLPRKFSAETSIIRFLGRGNNDYFGALQSIPRNLRLMYVHAYQSFVWNIAAGERWRLYGDKVVEGDLIISNQERWQGTAAQDGVIDADGEVIVEAQAQDRANALDDVFIRARPLSAEEAASGKYTIFDVVLPLPGYDVVYPANQLTDFYKNFMASERGGGLDPFDMRRKWRDVSLSGSYRKILSRPGPVYSYNVKAYFQDDEQFVSTDLDRLKGLDTKKKDEDNAEAIDDSTDKKIAVVLKFQLGSSQYATMALRELMKSGGLKEYKPDFGSGR